MTPRCSRPRFNPLLLSRGGETGEDHAYDDWRYKFQSAPPLTRRRNIFLSRNGPRTKVSIRSSSHEEEKLRLRPHDLGVGMFQSAPPLTRRRNFWRFRTCISIRCFNPLLLSRGGETASMAHLSHENISFNPLLLSRGGETGSHSAICSRLFSFNPLLLSRGGETARRPNSCGRALGFNPLLLSRGGETASQPKHSRAKLVSIRSSSHEEEKPTAWEAANIVATFQSAPPLTRRRNALHAASLQRNDVSIRSSSHEEEKRRIPGKTSPLRCFNPLLLSRGGETVAGLLRNAPRLSWTLESGILGSLIVGG